MKAKLQKKVANSLPRRFEDYTKELETTKDKQKVHKKLFDLAGSVSKAEHTGIAIDALKLVPASYHGRNKLLASTLFRYITHNWKVMNIEEGGIKGLDETNYQRFITDVFDNLRTAHALDADSIDIRTSLGIAYYEIGNRFGFKVITKFKALTPAHSFTTYTQAFDLFPSNVDLNDKANLEHARSYYQNSLSISDKPKEDAKLIRGYEIREANLTEVNKGLKWIEDHKGKIFEEKTAANSLPLLVTTISASFANTAAFTPLSSAAIAAASTTPSSTPVLSVTSIKLIRVQSTAAASNSPSK